MAHKKAKTAKVRTAGKDAGFKKELEAMTLAHRNLLMAVIGASRSRTQVMSIMYHVHMALGQVEIAAMNSIGDAARKAGDAGSKR